jgi:copper homeostasis protein (lipoprotein)
MKLRLFYLLISLLVIGFYSCKSKSTQKTSEPVTYKGLYSFGPDVKSFKGCNNAHEFWVADSSAQLELQYSKLNEKRDEAVYVEVQGKKVKTVKDGIGSDYDSTLVVTKLIKITKDIPAGCN